MKPMIWLPLRDFVRSTGTDVVIDGGFEVAGLPNWSSAGGAVLTRVAGTRTGGSDSYVANVAGNGGYIFPNVANSAVGSYATIAGWTKGDGVAVPVVMNAALTAIWTGTAANAWQAFIVQYLQNGTKLPILYTVGAGATQWDDISNVPFKIYTKNIGSLSDVLVGDGITPATMPTRLTPAVNVRRGIANGASTYLRTGAALANDTYSMMFICNCTFDTAANKYLCDARTGGGTGFFLMASGGSVLSSSSGTIYVGGKLGTTLPGGIITTVACSGITLSAPNFLTLLNSQAFNTGWLGNCYQMALFLGTWSAQQVSMLSERMLSEVSI